MNASLCIGMDGPSTTITNPETQEPKTFAFDFSYWSHDGFHESPVGELIPDSDKYATQRKVFNDIGQDVLNSAFDGYNSTLFAYGQTGAGKSFSMVGYGVNKGIIPIVCEEMFKAVEKSNAENNGKKYQVSVTMLEIYNEAIKDLLNLKVNKPGGLKVRTQPGRGVYVEDLTPIPVQSYVDIEKKMEDGTANRTVASTKMNATSSRAHTVFGISFTCITSVMGQESSVTSNMNLVDLAGSERAESTGATGDRLKEGCAINASLSALGNVISALADIAGGKKKVFVPYRNSALTRLLQDALGGNSRTIMIAALSPADVNYDETLGTLRYADRAKKIKNNVVKMENPQDKMIRMLKEENERLLAMLGGKGLAMPVGGADGGGADGGGSSEEMKNKLLAENEAKLAEAMKESERQMAEMKRQWEERLKAVEAEKASGANDNGSVSVKTAVAANLPYLINLHEDPLLSECVVYMFKKGTTRIGKQGAATKQDITFSGLGILSEHASAEFDGSQSVNMKPFTGSKTFVNGDLLTAPTELHTGDRVILGNNFVFRFVNPHEPATDDVKAKMARVDTAWQDAMDEFSSKQGLRLQQSLGGEMGKLEEEEAAKRKELEEKLAAMEAEMRKEREMARIALEQQKKLLTSKDNMTEQDKQQLAALEAQYATKARNVEEEIAKRRELSEKMIQEQMKRKRQTKKIEEQLAALMPLVNEANSMAEELSKSVRFEARLAVKGSAVHLDTVDELSNLKTLDITVRVTSQENGNIWSWNSAKFESRLFLMRELYQQHQEGGKAAAEVTAGNDPFWDPPEAIEIGKAYVYLKALSQLVEIENEFAIVDYKGDEQGQIEVNVYPEGVNGDETDYLMDSKELIGQSVVFRVVIVGAKSLPIKYGNDVHVTFSFNGETRETAGCAIKTSDPKWGYEARFTMDKITEEQRQYLLKEAAVFEVKGFSDSAASEKAANAADIKSLATSASSSSHAAMDSETAGGMCEQCDECGCQWQCAECDKRLCESCWQLLHKAASKADHTKLAVAAGGAAAGAAGTCEQCEEQSATVECAECDRSFCSGCDTLLHKSDKKKSHSRKPVAQGAVAPAGAAGGGVKQCGQCEEQKASVNCAECATAFCSGCNDLMHKAAKKKDHKRVAL